MGRAGRLRSEFVKTKTYLGTIFDTIMAMASAHTSDSLSDIASVNDDDNDAEAEGTSEGASSAAVLAGAGDPSTSAGATSVSDRTRKRKVDAEDTPGGHRPATQSERVHVLENTYTGARRFAIVPISPTLPRQ